LQRVLDDPPRQRRAGFFRPSQHGDRRRVEHRPAQDRWRFSGRKTPQQPRIGIERDRTRPLCAAQAERGVLAIEVDPVHLLVGSGVDGHGYARLVGRPVLA
jgi:hypothetical protein